MKDFRIESDSIGELEIPKEAYYGVQTLRAKNNFHITNTKMHPLLVESLADVKKSLCHYKYKNKGFRRKNWKCYH